MRDAILAAHANNPCLLSAVQGSQYIQKHHPTNKCNAIKKVIAVIMLQVTMKSERTEQMLPNSQHLSVSTQFQVKDKKEMKLKKYHLLNKCCVIPPCHLAVNREWWWCCKWQRNWGFEAFSQMLANSLSNISPISFERQ